MREAQLQAAILDLAARLGWRRAHFRPAVLPSGKWATHMAGDTGFPDLVLARDGVALFTELKRQNGKPTADQVLWLELFDSVPGCRSFLWRPSHWRNGAVDRALRGEPALPGDDGRPWIAAGTRGPRRPRKRKAGQWTVEEMAGVMARTHEAMRAGIKRVALAESATYHELRRRVMG